MYPSPGRTSRFLLDFNFPLWVDFARWGVQYVTKKINLKTIVIWQGNSDIELGLWP